MDFKRKQIHIGTSLVHPEPDVVGVAGSVTICRLLHEYPNSIRGAASAGPKRKTIKTVNVSSNVLLLFTQTVANPCHELACPVFLSNAQIY